MTTRPTGPRARGIRRTERWLVGIVMAILALVIEKGVLRSIRRGNTQPRPVEATSITATGSDASAD